jgi:hypothetical protein
MPITDDEDGFTISPRFRYAATFVMEHPSLVTTQVSAALRMTPDATLPAPAGGDRGRVWTRRLPSEGELAAELRQFAERVAGSAAFLDRVRDEGGSCRFLVVCFVDYNAGLELDFALLRQLARLRIDVTLQAMAADSAETIAALGKLRASGLPF